MTPTQTSAAEIVKAFETLPADTESRVAVVSVAGELSPAVKTELGEAGLETEMWGTETRVYRAGGREQ